MRKITIAINDVIDIGDVVTGRPHPKGDFAEHFGTKPITGIYLGELKLLLPGNKIAIVRANTLELVNPATPANKRKAEQIINTLVKQRLEEKKRIQKEINDARELRDRVFEILGSSLTKEKPTEYSAIGTEKKLISLLENVWAKLEKLGYTYKQQIWYGPKRTGCPTIFRRVKELANNKMKVTLWFH